jgi:cystathionine beta-lyase family protein involved in aluminum resistance
MADRDDFILQHILDIKEDVSAIKEITSRQDKCIDELIEDVDSLKQSRDIIAGGWKVFLILGTCLAGFVGWVSSNLDKMSEWFR